MQVSKVLKGITGLALAAGAAFSAQAAGVIMDGWELVTPATDVKNIGRLNLVSGSALVEQEVNGSNAVFVGAKFREDGAIFSITYTKENVVGAGDVGPPTLLGDSLTVSFNNVLGFVDALNGTGGYSYVFTSGTYTISNGGGTLASGSAVGIGGNASATAIIGGFNGDSTLLSTILSSVPGFDIKDSTGTSLLPQMAIGKVLFESVTNNNAAGVVAAGAVCSFTTAVSGDKCVKVNVASAGDAYLIQVVPEPGALALVGLSLGGLFFATRRRKA